MTCDGFTMGDSSDDRIESGRSWRACDGKSSTKPNIVGTLIENAQTLKLPPTDAALGTVASSAYTFTGRTTIALNSNSTITVTNANVNGGAAKTMAYPTNGVIYVKNGTCGYSYQPLNPYNQTGTAWNATNNVPAGCGQAWVSGTYNKDLTIATQDDLVVSADIIRLATSDARLGLIADNFVRVYHPVDRKSDPTDCSEPSSAKINNRRIDAAILSLLHSFMVDNYYCGDTIGTLTVNGVIAQKFRGAVGTGNGSGTGFLEELHLRRPARVQGAAALPRPGAVGVAGHRLHGAAAGPRPRAPLLKLGSARHGRRRHRRRRRGLLIGSFLNVVACRLPRGESLSHPRVALPGVRRRRSAPTTTSRWSPGCCCAGAAAHCGEPISPRYPLVEATTGAALRARRASPRTTRPASRSGSLLVTVADPDHAHRPRAPALPNRITLPAAVAALIDRPGPRRRLRARAADRRRGGRRVLPARRARVSARDGDGRRQARGHARALPRPGRRAGAVSSALVAGVVVGAVIIARKGTREGRKTAVPFGPFLALGGLFGLFFGDAVMDAYLDRF